MNEALIEIGITGFVFSFVAALIALALWIGMSKPKQPMGDCIQQAELVIYEHQARLNRQWSAVPKCEPNE